MVAIGDSFVTVATMAGLDIDQEESPQFVRAELVEALSFSERLAEEGQLFDTLSVNGETVVQLVRI